MFFPVIPEFFIFPQIIWVGLFVSDSQLSGSPIKHFSPFSQFYSYYLSSQFSNR